MTIAFVVIHVLIQSGQISVINDVQKIKQFIPSEPASPIADDILKAIDSPKKDIIA